jgi:GGDEF domain-containing protein
MHCNAFSDPENLIPEPVFSYQLTEKGEISAKTGSIDDVFFLFDSLNNIKPAYFESLLEWLLSLCRRHNTEQFGLIVIRMKNIIELTDQIGRKKVREMLDEFARRVREIIRATDLTTRTDQDTLWLLLPKTHAKGNQTVLKRLLEIKTEDRAHLELSATIYHAPSNMIEGESAKLLMARLKGEVL